MLTINNGDNTGLVHRFGANAFDEGLNKIIAIVTPVFAPRDSADNPMKVEIVNLTHT